MRYATLVITLLLSLTITAQSQNYLEVIVSDSFHLSVESYTILVAFEEMNMAEMLSEMDDSPVQVMAKEEFEEKMATFPKTTREGLTSFNSYGIMGHSFEQQSTLLLNTKAELDRLNEEVGPYMNTHIQLIQIKPKAAEVVTADEILYNRLIIMAKKKVQSLATAVNRTAGKIISVAETQDGAGGGWVSYPPLSSAFDLPYGESNNNSVVVKSLRVRFELLE